MSYVQKRGNKLIKAKTKADELSTARTIAISGGATGTATSFDGSGNITIPVTALDVSKASAGTLPVDRGGTGQTSVANIQAGKDGDGNTITTTYATKQELNNALEGAVTILPNTTLPTSPSEGVFYLVPTDTANVYDRYIWEGNAWVNLGVSSLNLTNYATKANAVNSFSVSGTTVTYTKADGTTTGTFTTQDENVKCSLGTTTKAYVTGTTSATTATTGQVFDTGVYLSTTAGELVATTFKGALDGNASSATEFASNTSVALTGDVTGSTSSKAGWSVATTLASSGVTAGDYGPSDNASPAHAGTFSVPAFTVDAKGRVTAASTKTITLPASGNTDTKVDVTLGKTTKAYILGTSTTPTASAQGVTALADTGVYLSTTAGELVATTFTGALNGTADKATKDASGNTITTTYTTDANFTKTIDALYDVTNSLSNLLQFLFDYYEITATSDSE